MSVSQKKISAGPKRQRGGRAGHLQVYSPQIERQILSRLAAGEGLNTICKSPGMPYENAVREWVMNDRPPGIAARYAHARRLGYDHLAEEIISLSDDRSFVGHPDAQAIVTAQRLSVDSRKWLLSKVLPRIYGDRVEVTGDPDAPIVHRIELVPVAPKVIAPKVIEHEDSGTDDG